MAAQELPQLETVKRVEGHHIGEIVGDSKDDKGIGGVRPAVAVLRSVGRGRAPTAVVTVSPVDE
jgi:hypothetical protein